MATAADKGTGFSLKDHLFNRKKVQYLADLFHQADGDFDAVSFVRKSTKPFRTLELKQRIAHIATILEGFLDPDFRVAARQITTALPPPLDPTKTDDDFGDFIFAPLGEYVVRHGMERKCLKTSLKTLKALTQRFSMEDAIRPFINTYPDETLAELDKWSTHGNYHVRRLVSEGTRPLLPWSGRLSIDPRSPLPLLDKLHTDSTRYVTRSVANHLNDIAKSDAGLVVSTLRRWKKLKQQDAVELAWMSNHALRTLVKRGDAAALRFLGFRSNPKIDVDSFEILTPRIKPGQTLEFAFSITAARNESLMVDYVVDFVKANGELAPKVFKLKRVDVKKGESVTLKKRHPLRANATTFSLYPGTHRVTLQVNGTTFGTKSFKLGK